MSRASMDIGLRSYSCPPIIDHRTVPTTASPRYYFPSTRHPAARAQLRLERRREAEDAGADDNRDEYRLFSGWPAVYRAAAKGTERRKWVQPRLRSEFKSRSRSRKSTVPKSGQILGTAG